MTKHAPGPWTIEPSEGREGFTIKASNSRVWIVAEAYSYPARGMSEANACLIAAAPDLLAALNLVIDHESLELVEKASEDSYPKGLYRLYLDGDEISAIRNAIRKAESLK